MSSLYFEDFKVGQRFTSGTVAVTADAIKAFAAQYDPQPFHLDDAAARNTIFGGLAASGWHTSAMTMRLLVDSEFRPAGGIIGAGTDELNWPKPVRPGDILHVEAEVVEIRPSRSRPDVGLVKIRVTTRNQGGNVVQIFNPSVLVPRKPPV